MYINKSKSTHSGRLERWLGCEKIESLSASMKGWHGPPINLTDVPGSVWIGKDGDFIGDFDRGYFDSASDALARHVRNLWRAAGKPIYIPENCLNAGFASIGDALTRALGGHRNALTVLKSGGSTAEHTTLWANGIIPAAGSAASAAPGGRIPTASTTGTLPFVHPSTGTLHLTGANFAASAINSSLLIYDRIFDVAKTMSSSATEAVTGVPTRYQSSTATNANYAGGNFLMIEVSTTLGNQAHNWTTCLYRNQAGTDSQTLPSVTGTVNLAATQLDHPLAPAGPWFCPLATGDSGIMDLAQMQCSAATLTGGINFVIGHPLGVLCFPIITKILPFDWLTNGDLAPRVFDNAAIAFLQISRAAGTAVTFTGTLYATAAAA